MGRIPLDFGLCQMPIEPKNISEVRWGLVHSRGSSLSQRWGWGQSSVQEFFYTSLGKQWVFLIVEDASLEWQVLPEIQTNVMCLVISPYCFCFLRTWWLLNLISVFKQKEDWQRSNTQWYSDEALTRVCTQCSLQRYCMHNQFLRCWISYQKVLRSNPSIAKLLQLGP